MNFLDDLKHRIEKPKEEKVGKNFEIQVVSGTHLEVVLGYFT